MKLSQLLLLCLLFISCKTDPDFKMTEPAPVDLELKINAEDTVNREFAFTDKKSGFFYGFTHGPGTDWFSGWNVNTQRIFSDYELYSGDDTLDRSAADVTVKPHVLTRAYPQAVEELYLYDGIEVIEIRLKTEMDRIGIRLSGEGMISSPELRYNYAVYSLQQAQGKLLLLASIRNSEFTLMEDYDIMTDADAEGFLLALAGNEEEAVAMIDRIRSERDELLAKRKERIGQLMQTNLHNTGVEVVDQALAWNLVSLDALIMKQAGWGIYAGLPWFNDYWGRDIFVSLPGATLVSGQLEVAANILRSFAEYQNTDENDPYYGYLPNRLRPDEVIYNSADGTPRFVAQICAYLDYGGDISIATDLFDTVVRATEGTVRHRMDEFGYLTHADSDTWMDAREESGKRALSPRGNRANDIQALWYEQLRCAARLARMNEQSDLAEAWEDIAEKMRVRFQEDFFDDRHNYMADRLTYRGVPSFSMRPNQLFALNLVDDPNMRFSVTREAWERLVYPWGTASLDQDDINFHPWHEAPEYYHKDAAYHNGTVWIWNNGIAMQRMIEANQPDIAWNLFLNMSRQTIYQGGAGMLAENTDALPRPGENEVYLSGTFSQAWSAAEYLRVWYQYFLGIRPAQMSGTLWLAPRIPAALDDVTVSVPVLHGKLDFNYKRDEDFQSWQWKYTGDRDLLALHLDIAGFDTSRVELMNRHSVKIRTGNGEMDLFLLDSNDVLIEERKIQRDPVQQALMESSDIFFENTTFAEPELRDDLRSLGGDRVE